MPRTFSKFTLTCLASDLMLTQTVAWCFRALWLPLPSLVRNVILFFSPHQSVTRAYKQRYRHCSKVYDILFFFFELPQSLLPYRPPNRFNVTLFSTSQTQLHFILASRRLHCRQALSINTVNSKAINFLWHIKQLLYFSDDAKHRDPAVSRRPEPRSRWVSTTALSTARTLDAANQCQVSCTSVPFKSRIACSVVLFLLSKLHS